MIWCYLLGTDTHVRHIAFILFSIYRIYLCFLFTGMSKVLLLVGYKAMLAPAGITVEYLVIRGDSVGLAHRTPV